MDLKKKLEELNEKIFLAGHRHDDGAWRRYTEQAVAIADELDLRYRVTGYGLDIYAMKDTA